MQQVLSWETCDIDVMHMAMISPVKKTGQYYDVLNVILVPKSIQNSPLIIESNCIAILN